MMYNESSMAKGWLCVCVAHILLKPAQDRGIRNNTINLTYELEIEKIKTDIEPAVLLSVLVLCVKVFDLH